MYNPGSFVEERVDVLHALIRQHPLAVVVTCGPHGAEASHVPVVLHAEKGAKGVLRFHVARANEQWKAMAGSVVLIIFQGAEHYITPSWYPSTQEHGKVVPTWNYVAVHVRGRARVMEDRAQLIAHLHTLTDEQERDFEKRWSVDDAPGQYIEGLSQAIVGFEVAIDTIEGKWKLSQNRSASDRGGMVRGLRALDSPASDEMAQLVAERLQISESD
jgi:transcriptional regulator